VSAFFLTHINGIPIYEDDRVSLTRVKEDGTTEDVLFWKIDGKIVVHPERLAMLRDAIDKATERPK
jgi:hypothetical protein